MKNSNSKLILSVFISFIVLFHSNGQKMAIMERADLSLNTADIEVVKGEVTAFHNYYLENVEVIARKTRSKAFTDSLGRFEIMAPSGDMLIFKANGFEKNRRSVSSNEVDINVNMIFVPGEKNENGAVTYGHLSEQDLADALQLYSDFNNDFLKYSDMKELLQYELFDVKVIDLGNTQVFLRSAEELLRAQLVGPRITEQRSIKQVYMQGGEELSQSKEPIGTRISDHQSFKQIYSRGGALGSTGLPGNIGAAIFVVDGMIVPSIDFLNPWEIKSVKLLRGPGAARYGSQGAYGVVVINTKFM